MDDPYTFKSALQVSRLQVSRMVALFSADDFPSLHTVPPRYPKDPRTRHRYGYTASEARK